MKAETYFLIALLIGMAVIITTAVGFPFWQAKLAPITVAGAIAILAVAQLIREIGGSKEERRETKRSENGSEIDTNLSLYVFECLWMIGFVAGIYVFGLLVSIPLFGIAYMKSHGSKFTVAALISVFTTIFCYIVFAYILGVRLYQGVIFD